MSKIPGNPSEVSKQWLQETLELKFTDVKIEQLKQHKNEGGVLNGIFKAKVKLNGTPQKLFIKIMPDPSQPQRVFIENFGIDAVEVNTYKDLFKKLEAFEMKHTKSSELKETICDFYGLIRWIVALFWFLFKVQGYLLFERFDNNQNQNRATKTLVSDIFEIFEVPFNFENVIQG